MWSTGAAVGERRADAGRAATAHAAAHVAWRHDAHGTMKELASANFKAALENWKVAEEGYEDAEEADREAREEVEAEEDARAVERASEAREIERLEVEAAAAKFWDEIAETGETQAKVVEIFKNYDAVRQAAGGLYTCG